MCKPIMVASVVNYTPARPAAQALITDVGCE
jgi:hypothetical protein